MGRIAGPEAELLTIAVHPDAQNQGVGRVLLSDFLSHTKTLAIQDVFLEVAEKNSAAIALYRNMGFVEVAKRAQYFQQTDGSALTAIIMKHSIK